MLLAEYAITPDVFDTTSYANDDMCAVRLETVREVMLNEGVVRDLRNGTWSNLFGSDHRPGIVELRSLPESWPCKID